MIPDSGFGVLGLPVPECYFCEFVCGQVPKKFRENKGITCPASYIYYSTKHNDLVEHHFDQTDNGYFLETR